MADLPHSSLYFGPTRDLWWNLDQLERCFLRNDVMRVERVLDVGSGVGHWTRTVARALRKPVSLLGIERELAWVAQATALTQALLDAGQLSGSFRFKQGIAEKLSCEAESFDMVTCQTVLMHLPDPLAALREMHRVLKPGGFVVIAEPNNQATALSSLVTELDSAVEPTSQDSTELLDEALRELRMQMICELGKRRLGLGFNSLGELVPRLLSQTDFALRDAIVCERMMPLVPPYLHPDEQAMLHELRSFHDSDAHVWPREETRRYFEAGGGVDFDVEWDFVRRRDARRLERIDRGDYVTAGAQSHYLFVATKS